MRGIPHRANYPGEAILTRSVCRPLQKIFDILTGGTNASFTLKWAKAVRYQRSAVSEA
jgi:hypothetical protein